MADEPDNLVLQGLRGPDAKGDRMNDDLLDMTIRRIGGEKGLAGLNRGIDRVEMRIERRLDLVDVTH